MPLRATLFGSPTRRRRTRWIALGAAVAAVSVGLAVPALADDSTGTLSGHLVDNGNPVPYASVQLVDPDYNYYGSANTDESGAFTFGEVPPGDYKVAFYLTGWFEQWASQQAGFDTASVYSVTAGGTTIIEESVRPHGSMSGRVWNADGTPSAYASVEAAPDSGSGYVSVQADGDGFYSIPYISAGSYRVSFVKNGSSTRQYAENTSDYSLAALKTVVVGETITVDQTFLAMGAITGTLTDANGIPVTDAWVNASEIAGSAYASTFVGPDGTYALQLFPGSYQVSFQLPNGLTEYAQRRLDPNRADPITVTANTETVLNEKMRPIGTVTGQLTTATGDPVADASVWLEGAATSAYGTTDASGSYTTAAFAGTYKVRFDTSYGMQWAHGKSSAATADPVSVTGGAVLTVDEVLAETGSIAVTATDSATHEPVMEFCAAVSAVSGSHTCTTDGTVMMNGILPGTQRVDLYGDEGSPYLYASVGGVMVVSGQTATVAGELTKAATISTVITDAKTGQPVPGACLSLTEITRPASFGIDEGRCSDATGHVTYPGIKPGSYKAFVFVHDGVHGMQWVGPTGGVGKWKKAVTITVSAGQSVTLSPVRLDKRGTISGTITDAVTGDPVQSATVGLSSFNRGYGGGNGMVGTDAQGHYTMADLGPYNWTLYLADSRYASMWSGGAANRDKAEGVKVRVGQTTTFDVGLVKDTTLTGKVFGPDGVSRSHNARITVINAETGDEMGAGDVYRGVRKYAVFVKSPQKIKLQYNGSVNGIYYSGWVGGTDFASATVFNMPLRDVRNINVVMTTPQE